MTRYSEPTSVRICDLTENHEVEIRFRNETVFQPRDQWRLWQVPEARSGRALVQAREKLIRTKKVQKLKLDTVLPDGAVVRNVIVVRTAVPVPESLVTIGLMTVTGDPEVRQFQFGERIEIAEDQPFDEPTEEELDAAVAEYAADLDDDDECGCDRGEDCDVIDSILSDAANDAPATDDDGPDLTAPDLSKYTFGFRVAPVYPFA